MLSSGALVEAPWDPIEIACLSTGKAKQDLEILEIRLVCWWLLGPTGNA